jgi:hypothetical protein
VETPRPVSRSRHRALSIDDVVVEGEWGRIEEITSNVVVRI